MTTTAHQTDQHSLYVQSETRINAPIEKAFQSLLDVLGPHGTTPSGDMQLKLEPWPGGRWYRDLGNDNGHLWGHVQVIKRPHLLEIVGPLFISHPSISHLQYRLEQAQDCVLLKLTHQSIGIVPDEMAQGIPEGWKEWMSQVEQRAQKL